MSGKRFLDFIILSHTTGKVANQALQAQLRTFLHRDWKPGAVLHQRTSYDVELPKQNINNSDWNLQDGTHTAKPSLHLPHQRPREKELLPCKEGKQEYRGRSSQQELSTQPHTGQENETLSGSNAFSTEAVSGFPRHSNTVKFSGRNDPTQAQSLDDEEQDLTAQYSQLFRSPRAAALLPGQSKPTSYNSRTQPQSPAVEEINQPGGKDRTDASTKSGIPSSSEWVIKTEMSAESDDRAFAEPTTSSDQPAQLKGHRSIHEPNILHESKVPANRLSRLWQYGGLATSLAIGAAGEGFRRSFGAAENNGRSMFLSHSNLQTLVTKLSRMRGAALKLGQMLSFQDLKMLPAPIQEVLQRVQDSADFMPAWQRNKVLTNNLGSDWRELFAEFIDLPLAAASIGQVHAATLRSTGRPVAVKIQYPGVAKSISSDLNNLSILLTASRLLPKGLYLEKTIANARTELAWECDYIREAEAARRFAQLLKDDQDVFRVPEIIESASASEVLTMERMFGVAVTKISQLTQEDRDWIATNILRLCLRELFEFRYMQTDPNWTNFLFNHKSRKIELLDFGASRDYPVEFIEPYLQILRSAARGNRETIVELSIQLGYLTGHESKLMRDAHVDSILTLAEPFADSAPELYDFGDQTITDRVRALIPVMLRERLAPPPEETYSLHRKLSGAFLLCARLGSRVPAKELFQAAIGSSFMSKRGVQRPAEL